MIKRLGMLGTALALVVSTGLPALASVTTSTTTFDVNATVGAIATISFSNPTNSGTFTWAASDFTTPVAYKGADNNPGTISGTFRTSKTGGGSVYFTAPATITGTTAGYSLNVNNVMQFTCSGGTYTPSGGTGSTLGGGTTTQSAIVTGTSQNACATIPANINYSTFSVPLNLYLNADSLPADTYVTSGGAFVITISVT